MMAASLSRQSLRSQVDNGSSSHDLAGAFNTISLPSSWDSGQISSKELPWNEASGKLISEVHFLQLNNFQDSVNLSCEIIAKAKIVSWLIRRKWLWFILDKAGSPEY